MILMYMKTKELGYKENQRIQTIYFEDPQGNDRRQVPKIWEKFVIRADRPDKLEVEPEEEADRNQKGPYILHSEAIKMTDKKTNFWIQKRKRNWECNWDC